MPESGGMAYSKYWKKKETINEESISGKTSFQNLKQNKNILRWIDEKNCSKKTHFVRNTNWGSSVWKQMTPQSNFKPHEKNTSKGNYIMIKDNINKYFFFILFTYLKRNCIKYYISTYMYTYVYVYIFINILYIIVLLGW